MVNWLGICENFSPKKTYRLRNGNIFAARDRVPDPTLLAQRVLLRFQSGKANSCSWFGPWSPGTFFMEQYGWVDGSPLLHTSTAQLRKMQATRRLGRHAALVKWELHLNCLIPDNIWESMWLKCRSASENVFLWQLVYRVIATQKWRFPTRAAVDETTWCTRCRGGHQEDVIHCIWGCEKSQQCWEWGNFMLGTASLPGPGLVRLTPAQIFIADSLPVEWRVSEKLWQLLWAIVCWQVWKDRNEHIFEGKSSDPINVIHKSWLRLGMYIRLEWNTLVNRVRLGKISFDEAKVAMHAQFGSDPSIWNLHEWTLQVPPVPPRPR